MAARKSNKIAVAMSGGVDSSLAALLVKKAAKDVVGITFRMWPKEECGSSIERACCSLEAITRARHVAEWLNIPYYVVDYSAEFKKEVIDYFCSQYLSGLTPNPCIVCNEKIKFGMLLDKAHSLGADKIATGHFAKVVLNKRTGRYLLKEGKDKAKDQSYFLFNLSQKQLSSAVFPLGGLTKDKVRIMAKKYKLKTYNTASSQDICFVRDLDYAEYIRQKTGIVFHPGDIVDQSGKVLGRHKGIPFYTIGQRRGLGIAHREPLYVAGVDIENNRVIVAEKPAIMKRIVVAEKVNWISVEDIDKPISVKAMIRYQHKKAKAIVTKIGADKVAVEFAEPQSAPTPGQAIVFYDRDFVVGGGWIVTTK